jgi:Flp pilus assembly protein TadG
MKLRDKSGIAAVEFALVLPLFMTLVFAVIDFGYYFFVQNTLQYATREGVRLALVGGTISGATRLDSILQTIKDNAALAVDPDKLSISIFPVTGTYGDPSGWNTTQDPGNPGDIMRVRTSYTYNFLTPLIGSFFSGGTILVQAEATYKNEDFSL